MENSRHAFRRSYSCGDSRRVWEYNPSVTMLADFDFEKDTIRVLKSGNTEWSAYRLKDVASAAFLAYQKPELHLSERRKLFDEYLSDREIPNQK